MYRSLSPSLIKEWREVSIVALAHSVIMASSYGWSANVDVSHFPVKEFRYCSLMHLKQMFDLFHTHAIIILARDSVLPQYVEMY